MLESLAWQFKNPLLFLLYENYLMHGSLSIYSWQANIRLQNRKDTLLLIKCFLCQFANSFLHHRVSTIPWKKLHSNQLFLSCCKPSSGSSSCATCAYFNRRFHYLKSWSSQSSYNPGYMTFILCRRAKFNLVNAKWFWFFLWFSLKEHTRQRTYIRQQSMPVKALPCHQPEEDIC